MITREFLSGLNFSVMTETDRMGFAGCQSPVSFLAEYADRYLVVLDGNYVEVVDSETLETIDLCEDIRSLPYETKGEYFDEWDGSTQPNPIGVK